MNIYYAKILHGEENIYIYDALTNKYTKVPQKIAEIIENNVSINKNDYYFSFLKEKNFRDITAPVNIEIAHPYNKHFVQNRFKNSVSTMVLSITERCNMNCSYCIYHDRFNSMIEEPEMSWETAKKAIDQMIGYIENVKSFHWGFYGGECLLRFDFIKVCVDYIKKHSKGIKNTFGITTNGLLLKNAEIRKYLAENEFFIGISLDGPKSVHDRYRIDLREKGTHAHVIQNIGLLYEEYPNYVKNFVGINSVCAPPLNLKVIDDYVSNMPVHVGYSALVHTPYFDACGVNKQCANKYVDRTMNRVDNEYSDKYKSNELQALRCFHDITLDEVDEFEYESYLPGGTCVPGFIKIFVNAKGNYFPCEKIKESSKYQIGSVTEGFNFDKIISIMDDYINKAKYKCKGCWGIRICGSCHCTMDESCEKRKKEIEQDFIYYIEKVQKDIKALKELDILKNS